MLKLINKNNKHFVRDTCHWVSPMNKKIYGNLESAQKKLSMIDPKDYCRTRNFLNGSVTELSAYIRHGILTLNDVRNYALSLVDDPKSIEKFIQELAWREFWQRLYYHAPEIVWKDIESYKTGFQPSDYAIEMPNDINEAKTQNASINQFIFRLKEYGYLHNHARMYLASYIVHFRRIKWQVGAKWMHHYLIDGDLASNNLSWQWIASTFSSKPYIFNLDNIKKYADNSIDVTVENNSELAFSYDTLHVKLFPNKGLIS